MRFNYTTLMCQQVVKTFTSYLINFRNETEFYYRLEALINLVNMKRRETKTKVEVKKSNSDQVELLISDQTLPMRTILLISLKLRINILGDTVSV